MATNNAINLKSSGIVSYDGAGVFTALANPLTVPNGGTGVVSNTAYAVLCGGTTSTNPIQSIAGLGSSGQVLVSNGSSALPTFQTASTTGRAVFQVATLPANPSDGTTYFLSYGDSTFTNGTLDTGGGTQYTIPKNGTVNTFVGAIYVDGTLGSSENCTLAFRKNGTTDTNITTTFKLNSAINVINFTSIGMSVVAGDYITVKFISASWATNPTTVSIAATIGLDV